MRKVILFVLASALLSSHLYAQTWTIDKSHSHVGFKVTHLVVSKVMGQFNDFSGTINFDGKDFSKASVEVMIDPRTISTENENRDKHLRSADFFAADSLPEMKFKSTKIVPVAGNKFQIVGDLTMRGVTKQVTLDAELNGTIQGMKGPTAGFSASGKLNRQDWGVSWNRSLDAGGLVVSDEVELNLEVEANQKP
jgi:polyisoprenoid-binding protein YceI